MSDEARDVAGTEHKTISPEIEPEYVGAHSALTNDRCQDWMAEGDLYGMEYMQCDRDATHTVVMADEMGLHEISMCDECGEPDDVDRNEREWTGVVRDD